MLKTSFGKAIVGAVALSGVATHAAYGMHGGTLDVQAGGRTLFQNKGVLDNLPFNNGLSDLTFNGQVGAIIDPAYTGGFKLSLQGIAQGFGAVKTQVEAKIDSSEGEEKSTAFKSIVPTSTFLGGVVKGNVYAPSENTRLFLQVGGGAMLPDNSWTDRSYAGLVGAGLNYHIDGGWNATFEYKHLKGIGESKFNHIGTASVGAKYNWS